MGTVAVARRRTGTFRGCGRAVAGATRRVAGAATPGGTRAKGAGRRDLWRTGDGPIPGGGPAAEAPAAAPGAADEAGEAEGAGRPPQDPRELSRSWRPNRTTPPPRRTRTARRGGVLFGADIQTAGGRAPT